MSDRLISVVDYPPDWWGLQGINVTLMADGRAVIAHPDRRPMLWNGQCWSVIEPAQPSEFRTVVLYDAAQPVKPT